MEGYQYLIIVIIQLVVGLGSAWLYSFYKQDAKNSADIKFAQDLAFLKTKGINNATKEDLQDITTQVEKIKNEISFEKQREHEFVKERHTRILTFLKYIEEVNTLSSLLFYYLHDFSSRDRLIILLDNLNRNVTNIHHENRLLRCVINDEKLTGTLDEITKVVSNYSHVIAVITSNAISHINDYEILLEQKKGTLFSESFEQKIIGSKKKFTELRNKYTLTKISEWEDSYEGLIKLLCIVSKLYEEKFHIKIDYNNKQASESV